MSKLEIKILTNADYLHFGSFKIVGFDDLTFSFDPSKKLMPDFWSEKDGFHKMREDEKFYLDIQQALIDELIHQKFEKALSNFTPEPLNSKEEIEKWLAED